MSDSENKRVGANAGQSDAENAPGLAAAAGQVSGRATVSIVIPAYNEAGCIADSLAEVMAFVRRFPAVREVIVVDDGSTDGTAAMVESAQGRFAGETAELALVRHGVNLGKGAAVRLGLLQATGDVVLFTDADLSSPISELPELVGPILSGDCDIVIGSRAMDRTLIAVRQSRFRETAGKLFNVLVRAVTGLPIYDTQCGFKAFRRSLIRPILPLLRIDTFAFDVELLYLARKSGLRIREIPVRWSHVSHTKVDLVRDSMRMFIDVLGIRLNDLRGAYRSNGQSGR